MSEINLTIEIIAKENNSCCSKPKPHQIFCKYTINAKLKSHICRRQTLQYKILKACCGSMWNSFYIDSGLLQQRREDLRVKIQSAGMSGTVHSPSSENYCPWTCSSLQQHVYLFCVFGAFANSFLFLHLQQISLKDPLGVSAFVWHCAYYHAGFNLSQGIMVGFFL